MEIIERIFDTVLLLKTPIYNDERGGFYESYNLAKFNAIVGKEINFVQDNCSISRKGVIRGMHYQITKPQGKLVRVSAGRVFDVFVDLRKSSSTFGKWAGFELSAENNHALWIPEGFAHGFLSLEENSVLMYKVTEAWFKEYDRSLIWNDQSVGVKWPNVGIEPIISPKDMLGSKFKDLDAYF
jgi:dTDP-4-dehydrorhamnose 3,5-epimerase